MAQRPPTVLLAPRSSLAVHDGEAVRFLDPRTGKEQRRFAAKGPAAAISPDFRVLVVNAETADAKELRIFDLASGKQLRKIPLPEAVGGGVALLTFSPDGQQVACVDYIHRGLVRLIDVASGTVVGTLPHDLKRFQAEAALTATSSADTRGAVLCRAGRYDEAVSLIAPWRLMTARTSTGQFAELYIALAEFGRGHVKEAKECLHASTDGLEALAKGDANGGTALIWTERVQIDQLRREMAALLK